MTREEIIKDLNSIKEALNKLLMPHSWVFQSINEAIKALSAEPCEDYISRAQALSDYADWYGYGYRDNTFYKHLKDMPPVTPQPKTGRWIDITNKNGTVIAIRCDCCGNSPKHAIRSNFCPNCGAKMLPTDLQFGDQDTLMSAT